MMGMYTGFRFVGVINEQYRNDVSKAMKSHDWSQSETEEFKTFHKIQRSFFIPWGSTKEMPGWSSGNKTECSFNEKTGEWSFQCCLKNYNYTIEFFLSLLSTICESVSLVEKRYEEWDESIYYSLENGKLKKLDSKE